MLDIEHQKSRDMFVLFWALIITLKCLERLRIDKLTDLISIASAYKLLPFFSSKSKASFNLRGTCTPHLYLGHRSFFCLVLFLAHFHPLLVVRPLSFAYLARVFWSASLVSESGSQVSAPESHSTLTSHLALTFLWPTIFLKLHNLSPSSVWALIMLI